jgi:S1-C subfamily serine protease
MHPNPEDYAYDLEETLGAVVGVRTLIPPDAFTADTLGTERLGNGVLIRKNGVVLTIGYLVTEAETVWLSFGKSVVPGHVLGFDQVTGFGLVQALARLDVPCLPLGDSDTVKVGEEVVVAGGGGRQAAIAARVVAKQEFAGYWEYLLDEAIFTAPGHPHWGGTALIGPAGDLLGIGSLQVQHQVRESAQPANLNMIVPINLLKPILDDIMTQGKARRPPRPWLGLYASEIGNRIVITGLASRGPAQEADLRPGDIVLAIKGNKVTSLPGLFRNIWSVGPAGADIPMMIFRDGSTFELGVTSADRNSFLKGPVLH